MAVIEKPLGTRIRAYRLMRGWKQEELAERLGSRLQVVSRWETGESEPTLRSAVDLAHALEITLSDLTGDTLPGFTKSALFTAPTKGTHQ